MSQNVGVSGEESSDSMVQIHSLRHDTLGRRWENRGRGGREGGEDGRGEDGRGERTGKGEKEERRSCVMRIHLKCVFYDCGYILCTRLSSHTVL